MKYSFYVRETSCAQTDGSFFLTYILSIFFIINKDLNKRVQYLFFEKKIWNRFVILIFLENSMKQEWWLWLFNGGGGCGGCGYSTVVEAVVAVAVQWWMWWLWLFTSAGGRGASVSACTCRSHQSVAMLLGRSCMWWKKLTQQLYRLLVNRGGGTPRPVLLTGAKSPGCLISFELMGFQNFVVSNKIHP